MRSLRDSQRSRLYRAEQELPPGKHLATVAEMQSYVDKIQNSRWFKNRYPWKVSRIEVKDGRGRRSACAGWGSISMPKWSRYELFILHELAHLVNKGGRSFENSLASHGQEFVFHYLQLIDRWLEDSTGVREVFREFKVKWHRKKR